MPQLDTPHPTRPDPAHEASTVAAVLPLPSAEMARFRRLMNYEGWEVDLARMCIDTAYAHLCLATAHTSSDERLRRTALQLFAAYDRNQNIVPVLH